MKPYTTVGQPPAISNSIALFAPHQNRGFIFPTVSHKPATARNQSPPRRCNLQSAAFLSVIPRFLSHAELSLPLLLSHAESTAVSYCATELRPATFGPLSSVAPLPFGSLLLAFFLCDSPAQHLGWYCGKTVRELY